MEMRVATAILLTAACAIHPPPAEPTEPPPEPETWIKPSVRRDCDAECAGPEQHRADCMKICERDAPWLFCGTERLAGKDGLPRSIAIPIGLVGIVVVSLMAGGVIGPSP